MHNINIMENTNLEGLLKKYKHFKDHRSSSEIDLTNKLSRALTENNLRRINSKPSTLESSKPRPRKADFIYVYCCGVPPFDRQAQNLPFSEECIVIKYTPLLNGLTEEQTKKQPIKFVEWAKILNDRINSISATKPIVLSYHSFGTYIVSTYLHLFPSKRVVGMIDLGGLPLSFPKEVQDIYSSIDAVKIEDIEENLQNIYGMYLMEMKKKKGDETVNNNVLENKYQLLATLKFFKQKEYGVDWAYGQNKLWPNILKCFLYGRNDALFSQALLSQKAIYYSYQQKWEAEYEKIAKDAYLNICGKNVENVQQRFVFSIEGGPHIMHMKKKYKEIVNSIVEEYLDVIENMYFRGEGQL